MTYAELDDILSQSGRTIYSFCLYLAGNSADADDLYQETCLRATALCLNIRAEQNPKAFLIQIAAGIWKNHLRKAHRRQRLAPLSPPESAEDAPSQEKSPESLLLQQEEVRLLRQAAEKLSPKLRLPLYMYYTAELSLKEISAILHIPVSTVKSRLWRAKKELKRNLEVHGYERTEI